MLTFNNIVKEIKDIPVEKLDEFYQFLHEFNVKNSKKNKNVKKTLALAGIFNEMSEKDYNSFLKELENGRKTMFNR